MSDPILRLLDEGRSLAANAPLRRHPSSRSVDAPYSSDLREPSARERDARRRSSDLPPDYEHPDYDGPPRGRRTQRLQRQWVDPEEMPFTPVVRPGSPMVSRLLSMSASLMLILLMAWLIVPELKFRLSTFHTLLLRDGVLSAQAVQLAPARPSVVTKLLVDASQLPDSDLPVGTPIAEVQGLSNDGQRTETTVIRVPFDARFASVNQLEGAVTYPGSPVATIYDPRRMYVIMSVHPETLSTLRRGMKVKLSTDVYPKDIDGTIISAVPLLGTDHEPTTAQLVNVRIKPNDDAAIRLVPGVRFDARVDLSSVKSDAPKLVFTINGAPTSLPGAPGATSPTGSGSATSSAGAPLSGPAAADSAAISTDTVAANSTVDLGVDSRVASGESTPPTLPGGSPQNSR